MSPALGGKLMASARDEATEGGQGDEYRQSWASGQPQLLLALGLGSGTAESAPAGAVGVGVAARPLPACPWQRGLWGIITPASCPPSSQLL